MKLGIIGDIHFRKYKNDVEKNYRERVLYFVYKTLEEKQVKNIIQLGDLFDDRKSIDLSVINDSIRLYQKYFSEIANFHSLAGNHDVYYKNTNELFSSEIVFRFENFHPWKTISEIQFEGSKELSLIVPWLNESNASEFEEISKKNFKYCFGHFEINNFSMVKGFEETNGLSSSVFRNFDKVFSGHFHLTQEKGNIIYVGSLFQNDRNDLNDIKRIFILDTDSGELEEVRIPFELFYRVSINKEEEMTPALIQSFSEKIVDVVFNIERTPKREKFIDRISENATDYEFNVIDNSELCKEAIQFESNNEEVIDLFKDYVKMSDSLDDQRKASLQSLFTIIYSEVEKV